MRQQISWLLFFILLITPACTGTKAPRTAAGPGIAYPDTSFMVISDTHFYDTSLGTQGKAFQDYLDSDRKLLVLSDEIIGTAMNEMAKQEADFIIVPGDLTKDGERICHQAMARHLKTLADSGKKVFVVPGNHDVSNPESVRFIGDTTEPEPTVGPQAFKQIYEDFGYAGAIAEDPDSLSYLAEPVPGLWLLALDSNRYKENRPGHHPITGGAFSELTLAWIQDQLKAAQKNQKAVIAFLHHGIMEHYPGNEKYYDEYLIKDYEDVAGLMARYGVDLVFTGHFHSQDITYSDVSLENNTVQRIFDIETGSMVTAPCPYRVVNISDNQATIASRFITSIPSMGKDFKTYAANYVFDGTKKLANAELDKYKVATDQQDLINHQISSAYTTHLIGDEVKPETVVDTKDFGLWLKFIAWYQEDLLEGWYTDLAPRDNELTIDLDTGKVK
jgi:3',5'-cyclic AMP phosphodiesterase CpdA